MYMTTKISAYFCIYKSLEQENGNRTHFVFKHNNSENVIANLDGNELVLTVSFKTLLAYSSSVISRMTH